MTDALERDGLDPVMADPAVGAFFDAYGVATVEAVQHGLTGWPREATVIRAGLDAADAANAAAVGQRIADRIRAELVCCTVYDQLAPVLAAENASGLWAEVTDRRTRGHSICYWGEAAARLAEQEGGLRGDDD